MVLMTEGAAWESYAVAQQFELLGEEAVRYRMLRGWFVFSETPPRTPDRDSEVELRCSDDLSDQGSTV